MRASFPCLLAVLVAAPVLAGPENDRVRCLDAESRQLLDMVRTQSPTLRGMLERLEKSDMITFIRMAPMFDRLRATTRIVSAVGHTRFVLVSITTLAPEVDRVLLLGHELRHAVELADAPWVRDDAGMIEMYQRIGWRESARAFETNAAVDAGRRVREEASLAARLARNGSATGARQGGLR